MSSQAEKFPLITISISCFNSADTVALAVKSAISQDWPNKEILIGDDGSSDNTVEVVRALIRDCEFATLIPYPENKGFAGSLNTLISKANGDFFAIFDDDDESLPERIRRQYERITQYESAYGTDMVICHTARIQRFPNGHEHYEPTMGAVSSKHAPHGEDVANRILYGALSADVVGSCANCSRMARTSVFKAMGGYDETLRRGEDTDFNVRFALRGGHFVGIPDPLVYQAMTMGQEKTLDQERKVETRLIESNKIYLQKKGWYKFSLSWLDVRHAYLRAQYADFVKNIAALLFTSPFKTIQKLYWALPAYATRNAYKRWHQKKMNA